MHASIFYCNTHYNKNKFSFLSRRLLNWLIDGAFLVHGKTKSEFQVGATLLLKANFLVLVLVKCT